MSPQQPIDKEASLLLLATGIVVLTIVASLLLWIVR